MARRRTVARRVMQLAGDLSIKTPVGQPLRHPKRLYGVTRECQLTGGLPVARVVAEACVERGQLRAQGGNLGMQLPIR